MESVEKDYAAAEESTRSEDDKGSLSSHSVAPWHKCGQNEPRRGRAS